MKYVVIYERAGRGWSAYVPDLPGCIAAGDTRKAVEGLIREAVTEYITVLREKDEPVPKPQTRTQLVEA